MIDNKLSKKYIAALKSQMAFRITFLLGAASRSVSAENSSDVSCNAFSTLRKKKKKNFGSLQSGCSGSSCISEKVNGCQPAFGQINQGSIKCCV